MGLQSEPPGGRRKKERKTNERKRKAERRSGRELPVIHSNTSSTLFAQLCLANATSSNFLQKEGFVIRVSPPSDSCLFTLAAN